jgi:hypothetical protein
MARPGAVADHHLIDDARRIRFEIDDGRGIDLTVRGTGIAVIVDDAELAVRGDLHIIGP